MNDRWYLLMNAQSTVVETASSKLCGGKPFDPKDTRHVLAVLGQRFGLNIAVGHPDSPAHVEIGTVNHLRVCLEMTLDRSWKFTNYPSEPFLSSVAAHHLHHGPRSLETALERVACSGFSPRTCMSVNTCTGPVKSPQKLWTEI